MSQWPDLAGRIEKGVHRLPIRVYYEDTDFSGIVYHANYLRFAERGRSDFLRLAGVSHRALFDGEQTLAFAVHRMEIDFIRPARIDDLLEVETRYLRAAGARLEVDQRIVRPADGVDAQPLFKAIVHAACIDDQGRPRRLPKAVVEALAPQVAAAGSGLNKS